MKLIIIVPTMSAETYSPALLRATSPVHVMSHQRMEKVFFGAGQGGYLPMAQWALEHYETDILGIVHDDLEILEDDWEARVLAEFADPSVMVVGFGGAQRLGHPDIYKLPYDFRQLARARYMSNDVEAEAHGSRFTGSRDVATLDSFALFIRRESLAKAGGLPIRDLAPSHCSDHYVCLLAHRLGLRVRLVGVHVHHRSGGAGLDYPAWAASTSWGSDEAMHRHNHRFLYESFRDALPVEVE